MQLAVVLPPVTKEIEQTNEIKRKKERTKSNERKRSHVNSRLCTWQHVLQCKLTNHTKQVTAVDVAVGG